MKPAASFAFLALTAAPVLAQSWDEALHGDLSDDRNAPTQLALNSGATTVTCSQQGNAFGRDIDYFTVTVPAGERLAALFVDDYQTAVANNRAFMGFQDGPVMTVPPQNASPAELLGGIVYGAGDVGTDVLPTTGLLFGAIGFTPPLPASGYTFWMNQTGAPSTVTLRFETEANDLGTPYCGPAVANSTGQPGLLAGGGTNVVVANNFVFTASQLPPNSFGFGLVSDTQGLVMNPGGSTGTLCLGGNIGRFVGQIQSSGAAGTITVDLDATALPQPTGPVAVQAGQTWNFQLWHRDLAGGQATSNFTEGLEVTFE